MRKESNSTMPKNTPQRMSSADAKENVDVALEINITTGPNVQVNLNFYCETPVKKCKFNFVIDRFKWKSKNVKLMNMAIYAIAWKMRQMNAHQ